jgi:ribulose-phosphate 3-epimerase
MDFHFVQNLTWGPAVINAIRQATSHNIWVHLMVDDPQKYMSVLELTTRDILSVHLEAISSPEIIATIKNKGWRASVAINPETPLEALEPYFSLVDDILIMSVRPGFSGQSFIPHTLDKLKELKKIQDAEKYTFTISMDGGINLSNIATVINNGATNIALGSALFNGDPVKNIQKILGVL